MNQSNKPVPKTTRRGFMIRTGGLMTCALALSAGVAGCSPEAAAPLTSATPVNLTMSRFQVLARICDLLIPATDTPGALAANVPEYIDGLLGDWANAQTRLDIEAALDLFDSRATDDRGRSFNELNEARQIALLDSFEEQVYGQRPGGTNGADSDEPGADPLAGYAKLKYLANRGYYHSEIGCTQELQYELNPGPDARIDAPLAEVGRTWAA